MDTKAVPPQFQVQLNAPQMVAAAGVLIGGQVETLIRAGVPPQGVVDMLYTTLVGTIARIDQAPIRQGIANVIRSGFASALAAKEIEVRTSPGGVVMPRGIN